MTTTLKSITTTALCTAALLMGGSLPAQEKCAFYMYGKFSEGARTYLFADRVNVRREPAVSGNNIIATLPIAHPVTIIKESDKKHTEKSFSAPWYEIEFLYKGKKTRGYVWGGLVAVAGIAMGSGTAPDIFLYGISGHDSDKGYIGTAKIVRSGKIVSETLAPPISSPFGEDTYGYTVSAKLGGGRGLSGIVKSVLIDFTYEACGYPNGTVLILFTGSKLIYGAEAISVSEAGVFHFASEFIFPDQKGGVKDTLIIEERQEEFDEAKNDYRLTSTKRKKLTWDGQRFIPSDKNNKEE